MKVAKVRTKTKMGSSRSKNHRKSSAKKGVKSGKISKPTDKSRNKKFEELKNKTTVVQPVIPHDLDASKVEEAAAALLKIILSTTKEKPELFDTEGQPIFLVATCIKIPNTPKRILRFILPNKIIQETSDVVLIVKDLEPRKRKTDCDAVVQMYESRLRSRGIGHPIKVMTFRQVVTEYKTYESKKQLCNQFDVFLADARINDRLVPVLGKLFTAKRKSPFPVKLEPHQLKDSITSALSKTALKMNSEGNTRIVQVGHSLQSAHEIAENILAVAQGLSENFPGSWPNIRNLLLKTTHSIAVPVYVSLRNPNEVQVLDTRKVLKHGHPVEGELSTAMHTNVVVYPDGHVRKINTKVRDMMEEKLKENANTVSLKEIKKKKKVSLNKEKKQEKPKVYESDSEDMEVDEAEEAYLTELTEVAKHIKQTKKSEATSKKQSTKKKAKA